MFKSFNLFDKNVINGYKSQIAEFTNKLIEKTSALYSIFLKLIVPTIILLLLFQSLITYIQNTPVINSFHVPDALQKKGYTSDVIIWHLVDNMEIIRSRLTTLATKVKKKQIDENDSQHEALKLKGIEDLVHPIGSISLTSITSMIMELLGFKQPSIDGYIIITDKLYLTIRMTGRHPVIFTGDEKKPDSVLYKAAEYILKNLEPLRIGVDYYIREKQDELLSLINYLHKYSTSTKKKAIVFVLEAMYLAMQTRHEEAINRLKLAIQFDNDVPIAYHLLGDNLKSLRKYDEAILYYKKALCKSSQNIEIYTELASIYFIQKKTNKALYTYKEAIKKDPFNSNIYRNWGNDLIYLLNKPEQAFKKFKKASNFDPRNPEIYIYWGNALKEIKRYDDAINKYIRALTLNPNPEAAAGIYMEWGDILRVKSQYDDAFSKFAKAAEFVQSVEVYYKWANALKESGKYEEAIAQYKKAIDINAENVWIYIDYSNALIEWQKPEDAVELLKKVLKIKPNFDWAYAFWGYALIEMNKPVEAIKKCEEALKLSNECYFAYTFWASALLFLNKPDQAIEKCKRAISIEPNICLPYAVWGEAFMKIGKYELATKKFQKATALNNTINRYYYLWGNALFKLSKYQESIEKYEQARAIAPNSDIAHKALKIIQEAKHIIADNKQNMLNSESYTFKKSDNELNKSKPKYEKWIAACEARFPPYNYIDEKGQKTGLDTQLVLAVMNEINVQLEIQTLTWEQTVDYLNKNQIDFAYQFVESKERLIKYKMVGPLRYGKNIFVARKYSDPYAYNSLNDFRKYKIGVILGYIYGKEFDQASFLHKFATINNEDLIRKLINRYTDLIVGDFNTISFISNKMNVRDKIRYLSGVLSELPRYVAFPEQKKEKAELFEKGLKLIKNNGVYESIVNEWTNKFHLHPITYQ